MKVVSFATTLPNIVTVLDIVGGEFAYLERKSAFTWHCHACNKMFRPSGQEPCKHYGWAVDAGLPTMSYHTSDGKWWFDPAPTPTPTSNHELLLIRQILNNIMRVLEKQNLDDSFTYTMSYISSDLERLDALMHNAR